MKIRKAQIEALGQVSVKTFEDEMVIHLGEFSPGLCRTLEEDQLRTIIRLGVERAEGHGFTFRGPVRLYLELMALFGSHFDTDPQYPWSAEVLTNQGPENQMDRALVLHERTLDYQRNVVGPGGTFAHEALQKIPALAERSLLLTRKNLVPTLLEELAAVYPRKAAYVGREGLEALVAEGITEAQRVRLATERDVALVVVLMLGFGHGCTDDPLYPWISRTLMVDGATDPSARSRRLEKKALIWLEHVLPSFGKESQA